MAHTKLKTIAQVHRRWRARHSPRRQYHVDYYRKTIELRRKLAREGKTRRYWAQWLVDEFCKDWAQWLLDEVRAELR